MGILVSRLLERPTIIGRTSALAVNGNGRFARMANMTGRELVSETRNLKAKANDFIWQKHPVRSSIGLSALSLAASAAILSSSATEHSPELVVFSIVLPAIGLFGGLVYADRVSKSPWE